VISSHRETDDDNARQDIGREPLTTPKPRGGLLGAPSPATRWLRLRRWIARDPETSCRTLGGASPASLIARGGIRS
jgi:hypothetical protein